MNAYIEDANSVQRSAEPELARANRAYAAFARGRFDARRTPRALARAEQAIRATRSRLVRIEPPGDAEELHDRLLRAYEVNAALAAETSSLAVYVPAARRALRPLPAVNRRLRAGLSSAGAAPAQVRALTAYAGGLRRLEAGMRRLDPPPVLRPSHREQLARLRSTRALAERLRAAVRARDSARVARLLQRFRRAGERARDAATFEAGALRAYRRRYQGVRTATADVERERLRLQRELD